LCIKDCNKTTKWILRYFSNLKFAAKTYHRFLYCPNFRNRCHEIDGKSLAAKLRSSDINKIIFYHFNFLKQFWRNKFAKKIILLKDSEKQDFWNGPNRGAIQLSLCVSRRTTFFRIFIRHKRKLQLSLFSSFLISRFCHDVEPSTGYADRSDASGLHELTSWWLQIGVRFLKIAAAWPEAGS
jgi:hypothetical protein